MWAIHFSGKLNINFLLQMFIVLYALTLLHLLHRHLKFLSL